MNKIFNTDYLQGLYKDIEQPLDIRIRALVLDTALYYRNHPERLSFSPTYLVGVMCQYITTDNRRCAIGRLWPEDLAKKANELKLGGILTIADKDVDNNLKFLRLEELPEWFTMLPSDLLNQLQCFHDNQAFKNMTFQEGLKILDKAMRKVLHALENKSTVAFREEYPCIADLYNN